jgi:hypothetical protein
MNTNDNYDDIKWMLVDSIKYAAYATIIYAVGLGTYWMFVA